MRSEFAKAIQILSERDKKLIFLTGDLGFNAFENLRDSMGKRFINAGVAEQNMIDIAAGMSYAGLNTWVYSIAPFLILKTVEQIRNDICQRNLPVKLVGNGGGYGYGIMGATHHILEDIAILSNFPNMKIFVPAYDTDVKFVVEQMDNYKGPSYLRLGFSTLKSNSYSAFRHVSNGNEITVVVLGPILRNVLEGLDENADIWVVSEIPIKLPQKFLKSVSKTKKLMVIEEHAENGGLGQQIISALIVNNIKPKFKHLFAKNYPTKLYGSQAYHLKENGLDPSGIRRSYEKFSNE